MFSCVRVPATTAHSFDPHLHFLGLLWRRWLCTEPPESSHGSGVLLREGSEGHCMHVPPPPHQKRTAGQRDAAGDVLLGQKVTAVRINGNRQHLRKKSPSHVPNAKQRGSSGASELCVPTRQSHEVGTGAGLCVAPCRRGRGGSVTPSSPRLRKKPVRVHSPAQHMGRGPRDSPRPVTSAPTPLVLGAEG